MSSTMPPWRPSRCPARRRWLPAAIAAGTIAVRPDAGLLVPLNTAASSAMPDRLGEPRLHLAPQVEAASSIDRLGHRHDRGDLLGVERDARPRHLGRLLQAGVAVDEVRLRQSADSTGSVESFEPMFTGRNSDSAALSAVAALMTSATTSSGIVDGRVRPADDRVVGHVQPLLREASDLVRSREGLALLAGLAPAARGRAGTCGVSTTIGRHGRLARTGAMSVHRRRCAHRLRSVYASLRVSSNSSSALAWVGCRRCVGRVRVSRRSVRGSVRGWLRLVASGGWRRG